MDQITITAKTEQQKWDSLTYDTRKSDYLTELMKKEGIITNPLEMCSDGTGSRDLIALGSVLSSQQKWDYLTKAEKMSWMLESLKKSGINATSDQICQVQSKTNTTTTSDPTANNSQPKAKLAYIPLVIAGIVISVVILITIKLLGK